MNRWIIISFFFLSFFASDNLTKVGSIPSSDIQSFTTDQFNNIYFLNSKNEIIKYGKNLKEFARFSLKKYGPPSLIDASNPMMILIYYPEFLKILVLDNFLAQKSLIDLQELGALQTSAVCLSNDNNIWYYDNLAFKLKKIDKTQNLMLESNDLSQLIGTDIYPDFMVAENNWLYLNIPSKGILVFDNNANYAKTIPIRHLSYFQVVDHLMFYQQQDQLVEFNTNTLEKKGLEIPDSAAKQFRIEKQHLYLLREKELALYKL